MNYSLPDTRFPKIRYVYHDEIVVQVGTGTRMQSFIEEVRPPPPAPVDEDFGDLWVAT